MGQTLSNGVYLPNEGERNCYAGLASNWQILNTAVGNIAEKAPLVHTHGNITNDGKVGTTANVPLITGTGGVVQAGSFGTSANTFCEGNDSRLSDARTPVAHTHTKSDITNLFNSANTWSADQTLTSQAYIKSPTWEKGVEPSSATHRNIYFVDKNDAVVGTIRRRITNGSQSFQFFGSALVKNGQLDPTGDNVTWGFSQAFSSDGSTYFQFDGNIGNSIIPRSNNTFDLGSSTLKWKTFNGVNPGALSLPNVRAAVADPIDTVGWNLSGTRNKYTPTEDGWFYIRVAGTGSCAINIHNGDTDNSYPTWFNTSAGGYATLVVPCEKGISLYIYISATSIEYCSFRPCIGNV